MSKSVSYLKKYFTAWQIPINFYLLAIGIFYLGTLFERDWIIDVSVIVLLINVLGTVISSIVQVVNRRWYFAILQIGISAFLFFWTILIFTFSPPDYYGANKEIPDNVEIAEPLD